MSNRSNHEKEIIFEESETIELKPSLSQINEIIETISAFANTFGGEIIIGVSNSGKVLGVDIGKSTIENITNKIRQETDPKIHSHIKIKEVGNAKIIFIEVAPYPDKLVLAFGKPFKRMGKSTVRMSKDEYEHLILEKHKHSLQFDKQICSEASLKDLDWDFIKTEFIPLYEKFSEKRIDGKPESILESLNCIENKKPTNAGILLFGKNPQKFFMNAYIAMARYKEKEESTERLDYKEFTGNLFQQIDKSDQYIKEHISIMSKQSPYKIQRQDIPEYELFSIRELITNAVCHRDYKNQHTKIIIKMFSDKIQFYNPGGLPNDITPQNITEKQYSRNPVIAKALAKVKYIEELGEGWNKIIKEHKAHPLKPKMPKVKSDQSTSLITIFSAVAKKTEIKKQIEVKELNDRQKKGMAFLKSKANTFINKKIYMEINSVSNKTAYLELKDLADKQLIAKEGKGRSVRYRLGID